VLGIAHIFAAIAHVLRAVTGVLAAITDVFLPVAHVLAPVATILDLVAGGSFLAPALGRVGRLGGGDRRHGDEGRGGQQRSQHGSTHGDISG
jgi:hypothetical protein